MRTRAGIAGRGSIWSQAVAVGFAREGGVAAVLRTKTTPLRSSHTSTEEFLGHGLVREVAELFNRIKEQTISRRAIRGRRMRTWYPVLQIKYVHSLKGTGILM